MCVCVCVRTWSHRAEWENSMMKKKPTHLIDSKRSSRRTDGVWAYVWVCLCLFAYVVSCMRFILIGLYLNMRVYSIELCVGPCACLCACVCERVCACRDTCLGIAGSRAGDVIRRWVFPNAVLSARWRGGIQMTCVQLWRTRSLGGNHPRCACVCEWERGREAACVSPASPVPMCSHDCVCVSQIHAKSLSAATASGPMPFPFYSIFVCQKVHFCALLLCMGLLYSPSTYSEAL